MKKTGILDYNSLMNDNHFPVYEGWWKILQQENSSKQTGNMKRKGLEMRTRAISKALAQIKYTFNYYGCFDDFKLSSDEIIRRHTTA